MFGAGTQSADAKGQQKKSKTKGDPESDKEGTSTFDKKVQSKEGKEDIAHDRYKAGVGQSKNSECFEQLDSLYRKLAKEIPVQVDMPTHSYSHPLVAYGKEQFDPEVHDVPRHRLTIGLTQEGALGVHVNKDWITLDEYHKEDFTRMPTFRLAILDTSGSMQEGGGDKSFIPWGDNSKYHHALLGYYGIERFFERKRLAPFVQTGVVNFSDETRCAKGQQTKRLLLSPQFGGTTLDVDTLQKTLQQNSFVVSLSDGDIANWSKIRDQYRSIMTQHAAVHIQLGAKNAFSKDLESWDIPVHYVKSSGDLAKLMVKVVGEKYKRYVR